MKDTDTIMALLREQGVIRLNDVKTQDLSLASLYWLHRKGQIARAGAGATCCRNLLQPNTIPWLWQVSACPTPLPAC
ncbi:MAG: type IV toxin-antitoxin system AbiEi family antitoxin domain-containing protein [Anaerolineae bacterium]